ncbi:serine--glyoxylate transaminase, putative [Pseudooceanicola batsensis HTCC2597]|uniref:Serine--glyoxylate transaminase, putative n=1 Tax=Pseudooceanicola batsensis (strain ATCC BAA-863 / DSM 15984 / KCTC 12145 / HTCC2597) TaxID=252305 RepID=A3TUN0_PSEBH|nr:aminotransferase class V-fold PLP-dependent enzyme [Pseudooceanicola batsensis]EAQ04226.1 serine--glyoxylate transaminase, putative [Pseudooceanicola batsensis HTCC2597]
MSLAAGRPYLAIPGPSVMPDAVLQAMHQPAPNIYEGDIVTMVQAMVPDLRRVAMTEGKVAIYISNGHGAWEASLANVVSPGEKVLVCVTGRFGNGWAEMAEGLGIEAVRLDFGTKTGIDAARLEEALRADTGHSYKAVLFSHVDTASSLRNDPRPLRAALDAAGHPALLMADCIASMACEEFHMDAWGVDIAVTGSQKGLMVPPGLAFIFVNRRAEEARRAMPRVSRYWDWTPRLDPEFFYQFFGGTAPTHHLFGLRAALDLLHDEGIEHVWKRHQTLARTIWAACEAWGSDNGAMRLNVADPALRSHAVTALGLGERNGSALRQWVARNAGVTLGIGLGMATEEDPKGEGFFRIGHMGHVNAHMVLGMLGTLEAGMRAIGVHHGPGGLEAAARVVASG